MRHLKPCSCRVACSNMLIARYMRHCSSYLMSTISNVTKSLQEEAAKLLPKPLQIFGPLSRLLAKHMIHKFAAKWEDISQAAKSEKVCRCQTLFTPAVGMTQ